MKRCCGSSVGSPRPRSIAPGRFFAAIARMTDGSIARYVQRMDGFVSAESAGLGSRLRTRDQPRIPCLIL